MTKRKSDAEKASNQHSRKRMAFTAPKTAATKAIIKRNAESSPLLRLPVEIRRQIFSYLLGDRLIHLKNITEHDANGDVANRWHLLVCHPSATENTENDEDIDLGWDYDDEEDDRFSLFSDVECYEDVSSESTSNQRNARMDQGKEKFLIGQLRVSDSKDEWRHVKDSLVYGPGGAVFGKRDGFDREMHLGILRTCRQIYTEANQVLWESNIFSFNDVPSFSRFMGERNNFQKRLIKKLRLVVVFSLQGTPLWSDAITMPLIRSLQGLRELWMCINARLPASYFDEEYKARCFQTKYLEGARKLATLPLTRAKVSISNRYLGNYDAHWESMGSYKQWSKEQQREYAELIEARLLDVNGARLFQQENDEMKEMMQRDKEIQAEIRATRWPLSRVP